MSDANRQESPSPLAEAVQDIDKTALLVIDVQNDFCHEDGVLAVAGDYPVEKVLPAVRHIEEVLGAARAAGLKVLHPRLRVDWEQEDEVWLNRLLRLRQPNLCSPGSFGEDAYPGVEALPDEPVIFKRRFSAFWETGLAERLREMNVTHLIVCGVATNICVQATACDAFMDGFQVIFVSDASGSFSEAGHAATLELIDLAYGDVVDTDAIVQALAEREVHSSAP